MSKNIKLNRWKVKFHSFNISDLLFLSSRYKLHSNVLKFILFYSRFKNQSTTLQNVVDNSRLLETGFGNRPFCTERSIFNLQHCMSREPEHRCRMFRVILYPFCCMKLLFCMNSCLPDPDFSVPDFSGPGIWVILTALHMH